MIYPWGDSNARTQLRRLVLCPAELQGHTCIMITPYEEIDKKVSHRQYGPGPEEQDKA